MLKNKQVLLLAMCLLALASHSQTMSLDAIIDSIRRQHPAMNMYDHRIRAMDEAARGARTWMPPQLGFGQFMTPYDISRWRRDGAMAGMGSLMLSAEQMFPNKKKLDADARYMSTMSSVAIEMKEATLNELVSDAKMLYHQWSLLLRKLGILSENEKLLQFMIASAELRYRNSLEKMGAYYKAKAALGEVRSLQWAIANEVESAKLRLNALMGRPPQTDFQIDTSTRHIPSPVQVLDSTLFYTNRSDLKSIDREIELVHLKQASELAALKPQFGIRFDNMFGFAGQPVQYSLMGMVRLPMTKWASKMNKAKVESFRWEERALREQKKMMLNDYREMSVQLLNERQLKDRQLNLFEVDILPALQKSFQTVLLAYEQNTEELYTLFDAWEKLNMKQLEYLELMEQLVTIQVNLDRITQQP